MPVALTIYNYDSKREGSFKCYITAHYTSDELPRKVVDLFDIELYCDRLELASHIDLMQCILDSMYPDRFVTLLVHVEK